MLKEDGKAAALQWKYEQICASFNVTPVTVLKVRNSFVEKSLEAALYRKKPEREYQHALSGQEEAHLIAAACMRL
ncbi:MAG: hypothetical protein P4L50_10260 [Anaerolineaceae bacterium]|nr:hypothetical protein [Anaerolineaceae bacterium]